MVSKNTAQFKFLGTLGNSNHTILEVPDLEATAAETIEETQKNSFYRANDRRSPSEIIEVILKITLTGSSKTKIVYWANLNFIRAAKYLEQLKKSGLITEKDRLWKTTEKGIQYIQDFDRIKQYIKCF